MLVAEGREGLSVIDVSEPNRPYRATSVSTRAELRALALRETVLATAEELAGVRLFDVSRPDTPRELSVVPVEGARDVAFVEELLVVAAGRQGLVVVDIAEPKSPRIVAEVPPLRSALTVAPHGRLALVGSGIAGVQVVDPFAADGPTMIKSIRLSSRFPAGNLTADGHLVYVAVDRGGFAVLDLENVDDPRVLHPRSRRMRVDIP